MTTATRRARPPVSVAPDPEATAAVSQLQVYARFVSTDSERTRQCVSELQWQPALWGGGALLRRWGRLGTRGVTGVTFYPHCQAAQADVTRVVRQRLQHGYTAVAWQ